MENYQTYGRNGEQIFTDITLHPGEIIEMELEARNIKKTDFAQKLNLRPSHFSELIHGKRHISAILALKLEDLLGISAEYWLRLQTRYDLSMAKILMLQSA